ncbi:flagellar motor switch protein FliN [Acidimicrobium ferrooxidans DSM 10331]|uniref:Flagellar motor switch protein FliN n=1 Tax=Acidimicrobium ferrooxidans (strain DSM 10331 / JCM 15462 / NBRC 103882 / ICP) TaxID=525909 RepID=C7M222_ACIFD|nr:flagellar motor switch protein FliN [Acidimicrobium ferrooxidans]ACU53120.1 flagellar motor switch protein FliN [Acidimicrobium ferrooxidans DSM 10331]
MPEVPETAANLAVLRNVELELSVELGRARMPVRALLALTSGDVIELDRHANAPVDVLVNGTLVAKGEVVVVDDEFGVRILEIISSDEVDQLTRGA